MGGEDSVEIQQLREHLATARTEAQMLQGNLASAQETVTDLQSQLQMVSLEAEVKNPCATEQVRQQGDKERHLLHLDKDKECDWHTEQNEKLQIVNQGLRRELASLEEHLAEVQQEANSEHGSLVATQDGRQLVSRASGSQPAEERGKGAPSPPPVMSAEEQTANAPIVGIEQPLSGPMDGKNMSESTTSVIQRSSHITEPATTSYAMSTGTE